MITTATRPVVANPLDRDPATCSPWNLGHESLQTLEQIDALCLRVRATRSAATAETIFELWDLHRRTPVRQDVDRAAIAHAIISLARGALLEAER